MKGFKHFCAALLATTVVALTVPPVMAANIAVVGGKNDDAFWNLIKKGIDDVAQFDQCLEGLRCKFPLASFFKRTCGYALKIG